MSEAEIDRIFAPCGLDIGASTVEETAVAVLAEIIAHRSGRHGDAAAGGRRADPSRGHDTTKGRRSMAYTVAVTWIAKAGEEEEVARCDGARRAVTRRGGTLATSPTAIPRTRRFVIYEQYMDEAAYTAHPETEHLKALGFGNAIPRARARARVLRPDGRLTDFGPPVS